MQTIFSLPFSMVPHFFPSLFLSVGHSWSFRKWSLSSSSCGGASCWGYDFRSACGRRMRGHRWPLLTLLALLHPPTHSCYSHLISVVIDARRAQKRPANEVIKSRTVCTGILFRTKFFFFSCCRSEPPPLRAKCPGKGFVSPPPPPPPRRNKEKSKGEERKQVGCTLIPEK